MPASIFSETELASALAETERQLREQHAAKKKERDLIHKKIRIGYGVCGGSPVL